MIGADGDDGDGGLEGSFLDGGGEMAFGLGFLYPQFSPLEGIGDEDFLGFWLRTSFIWKALTW